MTVSLMLKSSVKVNAIMGPFDKLNPVPSLDVPEIIEETNAVQELIVDEGTYCQC